MNGGIFCMERRRRLVAHVMCLIIIVIFVKCPLTNTVKVIRGSRNFAEF